MFAARPSARRSLQAYRGLARSRFPRLAAPRAPARLISSIDDAQSYIDTRAAAAKKELSILAQAFVRFSGDKGMTAENLEKALSEMEIRHGEVDVKELFETLDENCDGSIQLNEWLDNLPKGTKLTILKKYESQGNLVQFSIPDVKVNYTQTDEAPMLATYSLLPVLRAFCRPSGVKIVKRDISLAGRIKANFPEYLSPAQRIDDDLEFLGGLSSSPAANIIKLPNISASVPQLVAAIKELQEKGILVPDYPAEPSSKDEEEIRSRYARVLGSAVNPVLREGNSDRRVAAPVKKFAQKFPHKIGAWSPESKSHVSHMTEGDFFGSEQSATMSQACSVRIELHQSDGTVVTLKPKIALLSGEIIDASAMNVKKLRAFYEQTLQDVPEGVLWSLHLKATMMKISDPVLFGHAVQVYYKDVFEKHGELFDELGVNVNNGLGDVYAKIAGHPKRAEIEADLMACYETRPPMAYVDSNKGITNLHVPSDVIVDASMAAAVRDSGRMWSVDDALTDAKFVIPDRCYAGIYDVVIKDCQKNGAFDVKTMGAVSNVGLMAAKAEEYGSHDKTFVIPADGTVKVVDREGDKVIFEHVVEAGDVWRMCQTKDAPIQDWIKLAMVRAKAAKTKAIFWLSEDRAHDRNVIEKLRSQVLGEEAFKNVDFAILPPEEAMRETCARARQGLDTITVTGNVLRDYLTDLFPIIELGTSAKMLSIVPLLAGGGMFETGAGGSAPKHVQQFVREGHLRWDSLGEFLAMSVSLEDVGRKTGNSEVLVLAETLNDAIEKVMMSGKSPGRKVFSLDNRGSHFYLALYWAEALARRNDTPTLAERFKPVAAQMAASEGRILGELLAAEGRPVDLKGYYYPDPFVTSQAMRPSATFNSIVDGLLATSGW